MMAFDVVQSMGPVSLTEVETACLTCDRKATKFSVIELPAAKLRVPLTEQMSAKRHATFACGDIGGVQVWQVGVIRVGVCEQLADPFGHDAHPDRIGEELFKDYFVEVIASALRAAVIGMPIDKVPGLLADASRVAEIRVPRKRMNRRTLQQLRQLLSPFIVVVGEHSGPRVTCA